MSLTQGISCSRLVTRGAVTAFLLLTLLLCLSGCGKVGPRDSPKAVSYTVDTNTSQLAIEWSYFSETLIRLGPLVAEELVMIMDRSGVVTALDRASGAIVWQYDAGHAVGYVSLDTPKWAFRDGRLLFTTGLDKLVALDHLTGEPIWEIRLSSTLRYLPGMAVVDDTVVIGGWDEDTYGYIGFYRLSDGQLVWHTQLSPKTYSSLFACPYVSVPNPFAETVCILLHDDTLVLDGRSGVTSTGSILFNRIPRLLSYNTPVYHNGIIFTNPSHVNKPYIEVYDTISGERFPLAPVCERLISARPVTVFEDQILVVNPCNVLHVTHVANLREEPAWIYRSAHNVASRFVTLDGWYGYFLNESVELVEIDLETGEEVGKIIMEPPNHLIGDQQWTDLVPSPPYLYAVLNGYTVHAFKQLEANLWQRPIQ
jgi:predicted small lipoprotein YifL